MKTPAALILILHFVHGWSTNGQLLVAKIAEELLLERDPKSLAAANIML